MLQSYLPRFVDTQSLSQYGRGLPMPDQPAQQAVLSVTSGRVLLLLLLLLSLCTGSRSIRGVRHRTACT